MDIKFIIFVLLAIMIITGGPMYFYRQDKLAAGLGLFVLFILIFVFFGLRWFGEDGSLQGAGQTTTWPPYVNVCPDYLTYFEGAIGKGCFNKTTQSIGQLQPITGETPSVKSQLFNHYATGVSPSYTKYDLDNKETACMKARELGLTWEGITNGDSCTF